MKRICFVFNSLGIGGSQKVEAFVANACKKRGYEVIILCMSKTDIGVEIRPDIEIRYVEYKRNGTPIDKVHFLLNLRKEILNINTDLLCVFLADITRVVVLATLFTGIPIIGSERGAPGKHGKKLAKYTKAFKKCKAVVFQTEQAKNYYNLPNCYTTVIGNPCILRWKNETNKIKKADNIILSAGRLCDQKRFDVLIDAFSIIHKDFSNYKLLIYGDGPLYDTLYKRIEKYQLQDCAQLCGYAKDVFGEAGIPEIFVLSSDYEGIPNILMEAMSLGAMCISTDCEPGGARLLIDDKNNGLITPIGDPISLAKAIKYVIQHPEHCQQMAASAKSIKEKYSPERIENQWLDVINNVICNS